METFLPRVVKLYGSNSKALYFSLAVNLAMFHIVPTRRDDNKIKKHIFLLGGRTQTFAEVTQKQETPYFSHQESLFFSFHQGVQTMLEILRQ